MEVFFKCPGQEMAKGLQEGTDSTDTCFVVPTTEEVEGVRWGSTQTPRNKRVESGQKL